MSWNKENFSYFNMLTYLFGFWTNRWYWFWRLPLFLCDARWLMTSWPEIGDNRNLWRLRSVSIHVYITAINRIHVLVYYYFKSFIYTLSFLLFLQTIIFSKYFYYFSRVKLKFHKHHKISKMCITCINIFLKITLYSVKYFLLF